MEMLKENYNKQSFIERNSLNLLYSMIITIFILIICNFSNKSFFFFDDAQNDYIGYFREIGRTWLKGDIPFIIKNTFIGNNQMIELNKAIFLPQNIIISILSVKVFSFLTIARIMAFVNLLIISFFSLKISEALSMEKKYGLILSFLFCINPIFLYIYLPSWWGGAFSQSWFVASFSSILLLRKSFSKKNIILNIVSVFCLFASCWVHSIIAYFVVLMFYLVECLKNKEYKKLLIILLITFGIVLISINIYSEYMISSKLLNRAVGYGNYDNFLVPTFNQIFMGFSPVYYNFMHRYGGYLMTYIPLGYSSIYILFVACFSEDYTSIFKEKNAKFFLNLILVFFILSQTPSQLKPIQFPFRFLTYFSEIMIVFSIYTLKNIKLNFKKQRIRIFSGILIISSLLSFFSIQERYKEIILVNIIFIISTLAYLYSIIKEKKLRFLPSMGYSIMILFFMLYIQSSVNGILSFPNITKNINLENNFNKNNYLLSLTNGKEPRENLEDLLSGQYLYFRIKAINGYTPVGNKNISELLGNPELAHHIFNQERTVNSLSRRYNEVCYFDLLNIGSIAIYKDQLNDDIKTKIESCGYVLKNVRNPNAIYFIKNKKNIGNVSYVSNGISVNKQTADRANLEKYQISSTSNGFMVLSKPYWRGYRAYVNSKKVNVSDEKGLLKLDNIPKGLNNATLEIKYFPASWRITLWLGLLGIVEIITVLVYFDKTKDFD